MRVWLLLSLSSTLRAVRQLNHRAYLAHFSTTLSHSLSLSLSLSLSVCLSLSPLAFSLSLSPLAFSLLLSHSRSLSPQVSRDYSGNDAGGAGRHR